MALPSSKSHKVTPGSRWSRFLKESESFINHEQCRSGSIELYRGFPFLGPNGRDDAADRAVDNCTGDLCALGFLHTHGITASNHKDAPAARVGCDVVDCLRSSVYRGSQGRISVGLQ